MSTCAQIRNHEGREEREGYLNSYIFFLRLLDVLRLPRFTGWYVTILFK
jgi:hypothetical protein